MLLLYVASLAKIGHTCREAGLLPGCCDGVNCFVQGNGGNRCYCDESCVFFGDCCYDVDPTLSCSLLSGTSLANLFMITEIVLSLLL